MSNEAYWREKYFELRDKQSQQRKPLTDKQINIIFHELPDDFGVQFSRRFARAIEAAHGIKE